MNRRIAIVALLALLSVSANLRAAADATADAARAAVETVLESMERAVLAGDADGYLAYIAQDDSVFLQEQRMWAADLKRHVPDKFDLRIVDPAERKANEEASNADSAGAEDKDATKEEDGVQADFPFEFTADRAVFELEMSWEITVPLADGETGDPDHLVRNVSYPVVFERQGERWLFRGERWVEIRGEAGQKQEPPAIDAAAEAGGDGDTQPSAPANAAASTRDNVVLCFPGYEELAKRIAEVLPAVRAHVDEGFGAEVPHRQVVKIYPTMRHLQASIYLSYVDGLSGWNEPKESIKVLGNPAATRASLRPLLAHEYGHVATFEMGPKATDIAWWAIEGVAELASSGFRRNAMRRVEERVLKWAEDDELAPFASITDFRNTPRQYMSRVYTQGHHMIAYIADRFGRGKLNDWFRAMANGSTMDDATRSVLGVEGGFGALDADWRAELSRSVAAEKAE